MKRPNRWTWFWVGFWALVGLVAIPAETIGLIRNGAQDSLGGLGEIFPWPPWLTRMPHMQTGSATVKPDRRWSIFWALLIGVFGSIAITGEAIALYQNGATESLSSQVWFFLGILPPWAALLLLFVVGAFGAWLLVHFWGHKEST